MTPEQVVAAAREQGIPGVPVFDRKAGEIISIGAAVARLHEVFGPEPCPLAEALINGREAAAWRLELRADGATILSWIPIFRGDRWPEHSPCPDETADAVSDTRPPAPPDPRRCLPCDSQAQTLGTCGGLEDGCIPG